MPLTVTTPAGFVSQLQAGITALTSKAKNFSPGSVLGAIANSVGAQLTFLQSQAQYIVSVTRAATSTGPDLTSFVADYFLTPTRLTAVSAQGPLTFQKYQPASAPIAIPVGTIVQTAVLPPLSPVQYQVVADPTNVNYNANQNAYILLAGASNVLVTVAAVVPGTASNVVAGSLVIVVSSNVAVDGVSQTTSILNGIDQESDVALRARFQQYISGLSKANASSIRAAALGVQAGLSLVVNDQLDQNGLVRPSYFTVVVDDGSGAIPAATISAVSVAVNAVRAAGISFTTIAPNNVPISIAVTGTSIQSGFTPASVRSAITAALIAYVNANGVGGANAANSYVPSGKITYVGIANVLASFIGTGPNQGLASYAALAVNGGTSDIALSSYQLARATISTVSVT